MTPKKPSKANPMKKVAFMFGANDNRKDGVRSFTVAPVPNLPITSGAERSPADNKNFPNKYIPVKRR